MKNLPAIFWALLCLTATNQLMAQQAMFVGRWEGKLTQNEGGYRQEYSFMLQIESHGSSLQGTSFVRVDEIFAEMDWVGFLADGNVLHIKEERLRRANKPRELEWCYKSSQLKLIRRSDALYLEGPWQGTSETGVCIPGWIVIRKQIPKA